MALLHFKILTVFSSFLIIIIIGKKTQIRETIVENDRGYGEEFVTRIVHGEKLSRKPGYFLFTAPYRLCDGGCNDTDNNNFAMVFPLYVGKKGKEKYKNLYKRDFGRIHSKNPNAPFKKRTTKHPYTMYATSTTPETTTTTTTPEPTTVTTIETTPRTPKSSIFSLSVKHPTTSQSSTIPTTVKPHKTAIPGITVNHIVIIINVIPPITSVTNKIEPSTKKHSKISSIVYETQEYRPTEPISEALTQTTSAKTFLYSEAERETTINYDIDPSTNEIESESAFNYDIEPPTENESETSTADTFKKYTLAIKETPESDYNNINNILYYSNDEPVTIPQKSSEDYITNTNGVRCPKLSKAYCNKNKRTHVTSEIITLKKDVKSYKVDANSRSVDFYSSINDDDFKALHTLNFDRRWY